jgi:hypothetical protein
MENNTFHICEVCRETVDPGDPDVVLAHEMHDVRTLGGRSRVEGLGVYFHRAHFPGGSRYRLADPAHQDA